MIVFLKSLFSIYFYDYYLLLHRMNYKILHLAMIGFRWRVQTQVLDAWGVRCWWTPLRATECALVIKIID